MMKGVVMAVIFGAMLLLSPWLRNATAQSSVNPSLGLNMGRQNFIEE